MTSRYCVATLVAVGLITGLACGPASTEQDEAYEPTPKPVELGAEAAAEVEAQLAKADLVDGSADHVVANCPGCALMMEGTAEYTLEVADYSLHFCSDHCRDGFAGNPEASVLAMAIPEPDPAE